ncbi:hypothetical protein [Methylobacterium frigidaeris]|uniref:hypothetical protein n=1 Tax=Methylobacterium frigidaeris TaxID=2038277 RepID=UPI000C19A892|nr:hypothetical protein CS379_33210 [Methylobacterium frigidaeris]
MGGLMSKQIAAELGISEIAAKVRERRVQAPGDRADGGPLARRSRADGGRVGIDVPRQR